VEEAAAAAAEVSLAVVAVVVAMSTTITAFRSMTAFLEAIAMLTSMKTAHAEALLSWKENAFTKMSVSPVPSAAPPQSYSTSLLHPKLPTRRLPPTAAGPSSTKTSTLILTSMSAGRQPLARLARHGRNTSDDSHLLTLLTVSPCHGMAM
jgi:hypothetical protein